MKQDRIYIAVVVGLLVLLITGLILKPKKISWKHTYSKSDTNPFASKAVFESLDDIFPKQNIETVRVPANEFAQEFLKDSTSTKTANYILLNDYAYYSEYEAKALVDLAEKGNHVFVAAESIYGPLADTLGIEVGTKSYVDLAPTQSPDTIRLNFKQPGLYSSKGFSMRNGENDVYIQAKDSLGLEILSVNSNGEPVYVKKKFGKGAVYFHSVPLAFTNYYMIYFNNYGYISRCFSFLPVAPVYWDEFYKEGREKSASPLRVILDSPALRLSYILTLFLIIVFMLFQSKRRQRIIPVIKPYENSTLQFVGTVAQLYYNRKDHTSLAKKKLVYLTEKLRLKYHIPIEMGEDTVQAISARSGVDLPTTHALFGMMAFVQKAKNISERDLIRFNKIIEEFWKKSSFGGN